MSEKHHRSLIKSVSWRMVGTADTICLSWFFTGTIGTALKIGGVEFFTKIILYYLHERIWLAVPWARTTDTECGQLVLTDEHRRSIAKGVSWRVTGTFDTIVVAFFITGDYSKALSIGLTEVITKVFLYYLHERVWHRVQFGRLVPGEVDSGGGI
jgi:uncharacterized membrane protein